MQKQGDVSSKRVFLLKTGLYLISGSVAGLVIVHVFLQSLQNFIIPILSISLAALLWIICVAGIVCLVIATRKVISHVFFMTVEIAKGRGNVVILNLIAERRGIYLLKRILHGKVGNDQLMLSMLEGVPRKVAIISEDRKVTYGELKDRAVSLANGLLSLGLKPGDNYSVMLRNSLEILESGVFAPTILRARAVLVNYHIKADELAYIIENSNSHIFVTTPEFLPEVEKANEKINLLKYIIVVKDPLYPANTMSMKSNRYIDYETLIARSSRDEPSLSKHQVESPGAMLYTGGVTGRSKGTNTFGALTSSLLPTLEGHKAHIRDVICMFDNFSQGLNLHKPKPNVYLAAGPIYHAAPLAFSVITLLLRGTIVTMRKFDPEQAFNLIEKYKVSTTFMAPILIKRMLNVPDKKRYDTSSLKVLICAAAPASPELKRSAVEFFGPVFYEFYGSSDVGINTILKPEHYLKDPAKYASVGKVAPGNKIKIIDTNKKECPPMTPGDLLIRNFACDTLYYYNDPEKTQKAFVDINGERYFIEGEVAYYDKDGFYYIVDRKKDMIISGGVNIYPAEIEAVINTHPDVMDVAVIGIPDPEWGESVHAIVELKSGVHPDNKAEELSLYCNERLAGFKRPKSFEFIEQLPRDTDGKIKKRILREKYWADRAVKI